MGEARTSQLTGVAGVHFVASHVAYLGFHAVPTTRNVAGPDLLVSTLNGAKSLSLQVKTTAWAMRTRGRGENTTELGCARSASLHSGSSGRFFCGTSPNRARVV